MVADFKKFLTDEARVKMDEEGWTKDQRLHPGDDPLRDRRCAVFSIEDARRHLVADDPQAQFALA